MPRPVGGVLHYGLLNEFDFLSGIHFGNECERDNNGGLVIKYLFIIIINQFLIFLSCCCPWASERRGEAAGFCFLNRGRYWDHQSWSYCHRALPVRSSN